MAKEYSVDEFIGAAEPTTLSDEVDKKISLLYDAYMLCKKGKGADSREQAVRQMLSAYGTETSMDNAVHDVLVGNCTLNEILKRKGYIQ